MFEWIPGATDLSIARFDRLFEFTDVIVNLVLGFVAAERREDSFDPTIELDHAIREIGLRISGFKQIDRRDDLTASG
jgi:hypothetical protein